MRHRRRVLIPILIYCEGLHDQLFVRYLQRLYKPKSSPYSFSIQKGDGGSSKSLVEKAANRSGAYTRRLVVCDNDRGEEEFNRALLAALEKDVDLIAFKPCLEAVILDILEPNYNSSRRTTEECKRRLHQRHMSAAKRSNLENYGVIKQAL
ncbi:hypothetical protein F4X86_03915, partial [Candidatus Saccharibacteria bacterium]|nr:hypothetical protein [Candidatus Saccharibacteria bacterium]